MSKNKNGWLDQYSAEPFERQQFETAGSEGFNEERSATHSVQLDATIGQFRDEKSRVAGPSFIGTCRLLRWSVTSVP